jgi:hypothetical protein
MGESTDQNLQWAKTFHQGAQHVPTGGDDVGFVKFSEEAWRGWDSAINAFIQDIDEKILAKIPDLSKIPDNVGGLLSATDTRTLLDETAPEEIEQAIKRYREYLVELQKGIKVAYERLNQVDQG